MIVRPSLFVWLVLISAVQTNAKLADQLGVNIWTTINQHGATIQTAVDYAMSLQPAASESKAELAPHVAAVRAAYGDPSGKYLNYLQTYQPDYRQREYWFFDQPTAFWLAPNAGNSS